MKDAAPREQVEAMILEEAEATCLAVDWGDRRLLSKKEHDAIVSVMTRYMAGEITVERCAGILHCNPEQLPAPWVTAR